MARPSEPTLSVANDGDGAAVTATVSGTASATHVLLYRTGEDASWTEGESRVGDGDIAQSGLSAGAYHFVVQSNNVDGYSVPSNLIALEVKDTTSLAAAGDMTNVEDDLKNLLAASSTFQTWVGATGDAATKIAFAKTRIYTDYEASPTRPFAVVRFDVPAEHSSRAVAGGSRFRFLGGGTIGLFFEALVDATISDPADQKRDFKRTIDQIVADMEELSGSGGYLIVRAFRTAEGPFRVGETEALKDTDRFQIVKACEYGLESS